MITATAHCPTALGWITLEEAESPAWITLESGIYQHKDGYKYQLIGYIDRGTEVWIGGVCFKNWIMI